MSAERTAPWRTPASIRYIYYNEIRLLLQIHNDTILQHYHRDY